MATLVELIAGNGRTPASRSGALVRYVRSVHDVRSEAGEALKTTFQPR
jgi:hypothetical protein